MVRVAMRNQNFVIMKLEHGMPPQMVEITEDEAADIYAQLRCYLPDEKLKSQPFTSDGQ